MRDVLLIRHGHAVSDAIGGDPARPLSPQGRADIAAVARALRAFGFKPELVWHSPYLRTTQTAQLLADALAPRSVVAADAFTPESDAAHAARALGAATARCHIVVSHMPLLPALLLELSGARVEFGTGTVAHLRVFGPRTVALLGLWSAHHLALVPGDAR